MNYYECNSKILSQKHGIFIDNIQLDNKCYLIDKCIDGTNIIRIKRNNKWKYLGSKYNFEREIEKCIKDLNVEYVDEYILIIGFGLGHHIRKILNKYPQNKVLVIEYDINLIKHAAVEEDITDILTNERFNIGIFNDKFSLVDILLKHFNIDYINHIKTVFYANYGDIYEEMLDMLAEQIKKFSDLMNINSSTYKAMAEVATESYVKNLNYIINGYNGKNLKNVFKAKPAVIVSSGPCLEKNVDLLKEFQDNAVIITPPRNLKSLIDKNIYPHLVCSADPGERSYAHSKDNLDYKIPMILYESSQNKLIKENSGKNIFIMDLFIENISNITNMDFIKVKSGGSVANVILALAKFMGCNPIIFIGQDLAYTGNKLHASDVVHVGEPNEGFHYSNDLLYVEGNTEEMVLTDLLFNSFRLWIEDFIQIHNDVEYINCTEGGAKIKGTKVRTLKETLGKKCNKKIYPKEILKNKLANSTKINLEECKRRIMVMKNELEEEITLCNKAVNILEKLNDRYHGVEKCNVNRNLNEISNIQKKINQHKYTESILGLLLYKYVDETLRNSEYRKRIEASTEENNLVDIKKKVMLYMARIEACKKVISNMSEI